MAYKRRSTKLHRTFVYKERFESRMLQDIFI